jgi:hypothetical protein
MLSHILLKLEILNDYSKKSVSSNSNIHLELASLVHFPLNSSDML